MRTEQVTAAADSPLRLMPKVELHCRVEGHPTIADLALFPDVAMAEEGGVDLLDYPALVRWVDRVKQIPGFVVMPGVFHYRGGHQ